MYTVLLVVLLLVLLGALPQWNWHQYGYTPSGIVVVLLVVLVVLAVSGRL